MNKVFAIIFLCFLAVSCSNQSTRPETEIPFEDYEFGETDTARESDEDWTASISQSEAEEYFSYAVHLIHEGYPYQAIEYFDHLITNDVHDVYVYKTALELFNELLPTLQAWGNADDFNEALAWAKEYAESAIEHFPHELELLYLYAEVYQNAGEYLEFYAALEMILEEDPNDLFGNYYAGVMYYLSDQYEAAVPYLQTVAFSGSMSTEFQMTVLYYSYYYLGMIAIEQNDYENAVYYLEEAKSLNPADYEMLKVLAVTYAQHLQFEDALDTFGMIPDQYLTEDLSEIYLGVLLALSEDPLGSDNSEILSYYEASRDFMLESFYYDSGLIRAVSEYLEADYEESLSSTKKAGFQDYYMYYYNFMKYLNYKALNSELEMQRQAMILGSYALEAERNDLAVYYFRLLEDEAEFYPDVFWELAGLYDDMAEYENALEYYQKYLDWEGDKPNAITAKVRMAYAYYALDDYTASLEQIRQAEQYAEEDHDYYIISFYSGLMEFEMQDYEQALVDFKSAYEIVSNDAQVAYFIGATLMQLERLDEAVEFLEPAQSVNADSADLNNLLAYLYAIDGDQLDQALALIQLALVEEPDNVAYMDTLGWVHYQREEYEQAFSVFMKMENMIDELDYSVGLDEIYYHIGMVYQELGDTESAEDYFERGQAFNPENEDIRRALQEIDG